MAKRQRGMTENKIKKWLKEGRGQGIGIDYKPWLKVQDVSSDGRSHRERGIRIPRQYTFLSDLEDCFFNILEYSPRVVDIREQYPLLPIEETMDIANVMGVEHPTDPFTGVRTVMSTDFLVTLNLDHKNSLRAWTVKYADELKDERVAEKFEIERRYWQRQGVKWSILTENDINKTLANNIKFVRNYYNLGTSRLFAAYAPEKLNYYAYQLAEKLRGTVSVRDICRCFDEEAGFQKGNSLALFKHLVIIRQIEIDLKSQKLELIRPINISVKSKSIEFGERVV